MPALLTRISNLPNFLIVSPKTLSTSRPSETSKRNAAASPPLFLISSTTTSHSFSSTSVTATWAPCLASASAWAFPIPRRAPVTRATLPIKSNIVVSLGLTHFFLFCHSRPRSGRGQATAGIQYLAVFLTPWVPVPRLREDKLHGNDTDCVSSSTNYFSMFSDPAQCIEQFDLQSGSRVADLGAGMGAFSIPAAKAVGEAGKVYAVEIQKGLLDRLKNEARAARAGNVEALWGDVERVHGTHLSDASVNACVASNVLFQVEDKDGFVTEVKRILRPGGKLLLIDWSDSFSNIGPHKDHVVAEADARALFEKAGFRFVKQINAGEHHYGLIKKKILRR